MYTGHALVKVFGRQKEAVEVFDEHNQKLYGSAFKEFERETDDIARARGLAMGHATAGHAADSDRSLAALVERHRQDGAREIAQVYAWRNERDKAFEWLDRAYAQRDVGLAELTGEPLFRNLESDPRWTAFLTEKMKLPR